MTKTQQQCLDTLMNRLTPAMRAKYARGSREHQKTDQLSRKGILDLLYDIRDELIDALFYTEADIEKVEGFIHRVDQAHQSAKQVAVYSLSKVDKTKSKRGKHGIHSLS